MALISSALNLQFGFFLTLLRLLKIREDEV